MALLVTVGALAGLRLAELARSSRNERLLRARGALEADAGHYKWIVLLHVGFLVCLTGEAWLRGRGGSVDPVALAGAALAQLLRFWSLATLGGRWSVRILVLPGAEPVRKGPYRFIRHPNYLAVTAEFIFFPWMFHAWLTALIFSALNFAVLRHRIRAEEEALDQDGVYIRSMAGVSRGFLWSLRRRGTV